MQNKIILASKSKVRKEILDKHNIECDVEPSNVDEEAVKIAMIKDKATPEIISKNFEEEFPYVFEHLIKLYQRQEFKEVMQDYLDKAFT